MAYGRVIDQGGPRSRPQRHFHPVGGAATPVERATQLKRRRAGVVAHLQELTVEALDQSRAEKDGSATASARLDTLVVLGEGLLAQLRAIDAALARSEAGSLGRCTACGRAIEPARLDEMPEAAICLACAREERAYSAR